MPMVSLLQLNTSFPRIAGDIASPYTWCADLDIHIVPELSVARVINADPGAANITAVEAAVDKAQGDILTTSCGFLCYWQDRLEARTATTFVSSALLALPKLRQIFADDELAILTFNADVLGSPAFAPSLGGFGGPIVDLGEESYLRQVISNNLPALDRQRAEDEIVRLVDGMCADGKVKALLLECTNLPPYKQALKAKFDIEIFDILTLIDSIKANLVDPAYL